MRLNRYMPRPRSLDGTYETSIDAGELGDLDVTVDYEIDPADPSVGIMDTGIIVNRVVAECSQTTFDVTDMLRESWKSDIAARILDDLAEGYDEW